MHPALTIQGGAALAQRQLAAHIGSLIIASVAVPKPVRIT
jgi:hypothetical protein